MTYTTNSYYSESSSRGGGRIASNAYRKSLVDCEDFTGLEENTHRYYLLLLVKRRGKLAGFSPRMIHLLDYYMAFTGELDWEEGSRPIVYQSLSRTALDLGLSERQVQKFEAALFAAGALTWNDSGNHRRYGQRDAKSGRILYAYGVDLTPLAYLRSELEEKLHEKQLYDNAWMETKRQISWYRRQIRSLMLEWQEEGACVAAIGCFEQRYEQIAIQLRTSIDLPSLRRLLASHKSLQNELLKAMGIEAAKIETVSQRASLSMKTPKGSSQSEPEFVHYKYTTHQSSDNLL